MGARITPLEEDSRRIEELDGRLGVGRRYGGNVVRLGNVVRSVPSARFTCGLYPWRGLTLVLSPETTGRKKGAKTRHEEGGCGKQGLATAGASALLDRCSSYLLLVRRRALKHRAPGN